MAGEVLTILIDHRERAPVVVRSLQGLGARLEITDLALADYVVGGRVGVERKTVADLHRSIADGRLWTQVAGLRDDLRRAFLIVEGPRLDRGRISAGGIRGALLTVADLGVVVIRTADGNDTAHWLWRIAHRYRGDASRVHRTRRRGQHGAVAALVSIDGVSQTLANGLLARFESIAGIATATTAQLESVPGIGPTKASRIRSILTERPPY